MGAKKSEQNSGQNNQQVMLAARELITRWQIETALSVMNMTTNALSHYLRSPVDAEPQESFKPVDSEAKISLENTLKAAAERLEKLMNDDARWDIAFQMEAEKQFAANQKLQHEVLAHQKSAAQEITSPHFRYRPAILRLNDGTWTAFLGDVNFMDQGVLGVGESPAAAIEAFDDAWRGVTNEKVLAWAKEREKNLEQGEETKPFPNLTDEQKTLDGRRDKHPPEQPEGGNTGDGDSCGVGPSA